jgi:hypothetical protein
LGESSSKVPWFNPPITKSVDGDSAGSLLGEREEKYAVAFVGMRVGTKLGIGVRLGDTSREGNAEGFLWVVGGFVKTTT